MSYIRAFVPLKHPACARDRLLEALTAKQRHSMYFTLARRIITALRDVALVRDTVIVTSSAEVEIFAGHLGVRVMHQMRDEGINSACEAAIASSSAGTTWEPTHWSAPRRTLSGFTLAPIASGSTCGRPGSTAWRPGYSNRVNWL